MSTSPAAFSSTMVDQLYNSMANNRRIALVESCFGNSGQPLNVDGRVLVGQGVLQKSCRKALKNRRFFLFNDILVYGNIIVDMKRYSKQHVIPLEEVKLEILQDEGDRKNGWLICARGKSFAVYAATPGERREWMLHTEKCIKNRLASSGKAAASDHAAVWVPDNDAPKCMRCSGKFTVINRRHHCRKCGAVVCNGCSSKKYLLPAQSKKPLRVCDNCYQTLTLTSGGQNIGGSSTNQSTPGGASALSYSTASSDSKFGDADSSGEEDSEDEGDNPIEATPTGSTWALMRPDGQENSVPLEGCIGSSSHPDHQGASSLSEVEAALDEVQQDMSKNYIYADEGRINAKTSMLGPLPRIS